MIDSFIPAVIFQKQNRTLKSTLLGIDLSPGHNHFIRQGWLELWAFVSTSQDGKLIRSFRKAYHNGIDGTANDSKEDAGQAHAQYKSNREEGIPQDRHVRWSIIVVWIILRSLTKRSREWSNDKEPAPELTNNNSDKKAWSRVYYRAI